MDWFFPCKNEEYFQRGRIWTGKDCSTKKLFCFHVNFRTLKPLDPAYKEFGYHEHLALTANFFLEKEHL